jgi:alanyl-tRNA synthetase
VNKNDPRCIEIWNLVFIQFNANPDGSFTPLPQRHVDTGMGFERAVAIIQGTKNLTDFSGTTSNYETDVFRPIFDELEKLSGRKYASTLPIVRGSTPGSGVAIGGSPIEKVAASRGDQHASGVRSPEQIQIDIAFRVLVCDCRRNYSIKRRPRVRFASYCASCSSLRAHARFPRTILFQACRCGGKDNGRRVP